MREAKGTALIEFVLLMFVAACCDEQAELGHELGGVGNGTLYVFYGLTALLISKPATKYLGARNALVRKINPAVPLSIA